MRAPRAAVLGAALVLGAAVWPQTGERRPLDGVVAVVNDDVILASELGEEVAIRLYQLGPSGSTKDIKTFTGEVLNTMVETRLLIQDADAHNIVVTTDDIKPYVDEELARIRESFPTAEAYEAALAAYGMTEKIYAAQLRKNVRDQIKITRLTDEVLGPKVVIDESELRAYYDAHRAELAEPTLVTLREIAVAKKPTDASVARLRARLDEVRRGALAEGDFAKAAKALADAEGGEFNGSFVFGPGEAVPAMEEAAAKLKAGQISPVTRGPDGLWLVRLVGESGGRAEVKYLHVPLKVTAEDVAAARARVEAAAAALARGEVFDDVARAYSDSEESSARGGLVGEVALEDLTQDMPEVARALSALAPGQTTPPVERPEGFFLVRLEARKEGRDVSYDDARETIKRTLRAQKLGLEQQKYLLELKAKAYIKIYD